MRLTTAEKAYWRVMQQHNAAMLRAATTPKRHKYGVAPDADRTYNGIRYDSKAEAHYAYVLDKLKWAGEVQHWQRQQRYPLHVNGRKVGTYLMDFNVWYADGRKVLVEVKGYQTPEWRFKWRVFLACHEEALRADGWDILIERVERRG